MQKLWKLYIKNLSAFCKLHVAFQKEIVKWLQNDCIGSLVFVYTATEQEK